MYLVKSDMEQWKDMRFGMFIHWGLYALMGRGEWAMYNEAIDVDVYRRLMDRFTAEKFDARAWAKAAKTAGMKYMVLTTRHHDGFSLWDSKCSVGGFTSMQSAAHRDFVREYVDACRAEGLKVGLYYSPLDWRLPGFFFPRMYARSANELRRQCHEQIRELLTNYGKIDIMWIDGGEDAWLCHGRNLHASDGGKGEVQCPGFWHADELDKMMRELQPGIVINNRYGDRSLGDYLTPEGHAGSFNVNEPWESCMTINAAWGWTPTPPRSLREIISLLAHNATGDGNFLFNVGPRADGSIEPEQLERLREVGEWLNRYGESIYSTRGGPYRNTDWGGMTYRDNVIYVHIWDWKQGRITLPKLDADIVSVESLTAQNLHTELCGGRLSISVGESDCMMPDTIIKIELDRNARELADATVAWCGSYASDMTNGALIVDELI